MDIKILKRTDASTVYEIADFALLSDKFLADINWPPNGGHLVFAARRMLDDEYLLLTTNISRNYIVKIEYGALREELKSLPLAADSQIRLAQPADMEHLRRLYSATDTKYFYERWRKYLTEDYITGLDSFIKEYVSLERTICVKRGNEDAGLLVLVDWKDYLDNPADWIAWAWLDQNLTVTERKAAHAELVAWMRSHVSERIHGVVYSFNRRAQKSSRAMGLVPVCVHISRNV